MDEQRLYQTLKQQFGFDEFRPGQKETIQAVLNQNDVLAVLANGGRQDAAVSAASLSDAGQRLDRFATDLFNAGSSRPPASAW